MSVDRKPTSTEDVFDLPEEARINLDELLSIENYYAGRETVYTLRDTGIDERTSVDNFINGNGDKFFVTQ